jgi:hypothetical protein
LFACFGSNHVHLLLVGRDVKGLKSVSVFQHKRLEVETVLRGVKKAGPIFWDFVFSTFFVPAAKQEG